MFQVRGLFGIDRCRLVGNFFGRARLRDSDELLAALTLQRGTRSRSIQLERGAAMRTLENEVAWSVCRRFRRFSGIRLHRTKKSKGYTTHRDVTAWRFSVSSTPVFVTSCRIFAVR